MLTVITLFRLDQIISAKKNLEYPSLKHYRNAASHRRTFDDTIIMVVRIICDRTQEQSLPNMISTSSSDDEEIGREFSQNHKQRFTRNSLQVVDRSSWFHSIEGSPKRNLKKFYENVTPTSKSFSRRITCSGSPIYRVSVVGKKIETDGSGSRNSCAQCGKLTHIYCTNCHVWFCGPHVGRCDEEGRSTVVCFSNTPKIYGLKTCWMDWHESGLQMMHEQITMNDE